MTAALTLEIILVLVGLVVYLPVAKRRGFSGGLGVVILMAIFSLLTAAAMTSSTPPDLTGAAVSWVAAPLVLSAVAFWLDRPSNYS